MRWASWGGRSFSDPKTLEEELLARAQVRNEREEEGEKLGELESTTDGDLRGNLVLMSPEKVIKAAATDEALLFEDTGYGNISLLAGGREISSFFGQSLAIGGAYDLGRGEDTVNEGSLVSLRVHMPLRFLTNGCDTQYRTMRGGELLSLVEEVDRCASPKLEGPL